MKYRTADTKDFKFEIKEGQKILGFMGILDYTKGIEME